MLNSRFMAVFLAAFALCALLTIVQARHEAEAARNGHDTFGTNYYGWRGVHDTMQRLGLPVARGKTPPAADAPRDRTWIFWEPSRDLAAAAPAHAQALRQWVQAGGHAVVAPVRGESTVAAAMATAARAHYPELADAPGEARDFLLHALLGDRVGLEMRFAPESSPADDAPAPKDRPARDGKPRSFSEHVEAYAKQADAFRQPREDALEGTGRFRQLAATVSRMSLPRDLQVLVIPGQPEAALYVVDDDQSLPIAADFSVGKGKVTAVGDPTLLCNSYLGRPGNAAVAVALLHAPGKTTWFDEFYHGHAMRGSVLRLFLVPPYALALAALGLLLGLAAWRHGVGFGPPLAPKGAPRRTVREHVAALAAMLQRGRTQQFVLRGLLNGALWQCRHRDGGGMATGAANIDAVAARIAHREPERAARFAAAARRCEELAAAPTPPGARQALAAARGLLRETFPPPGAAPTPPHKE